MVVYRRTGKVGDLSEDPTQTIRDILNSPEFQFESGFNLPPIGGGSSSSNSLSGQASLLNAGLASDKFNYQVQQDATKRAQEAAQALAKKNALINMYKSGGFYPTEDLLGSIEDMRTAASGGINEQLLASLAGVGEGYGAAQDLTSTGYSDLRNYLSQEQANPYQNVQLSGGNVANDLQSLLTSQGAVSPDVSQYAQALNADLQSGTSQFQNLLSTLAALETSSRSSRQREAEMAGTVAGTSLGQQRASSEAQLRSQANQALVQLANDIAQKQFEVRQNEAAQKAAIAQSLAEAGIDVFSGNFDTGDEPTGFETTPITTDGAPVVVDDSAGGITENPFTGTFPTGLPGTTEVVPEPTYSTTGVPKSGTAPAGFHYDQSGQLVPNLGKEAPGYKPPTAAQVAAKPSTPAGVGLHWEWNGGKWVATPNKGTVAPTATPAPSIPTFADNPGQARIMAEQTAPAAVASIAAIPELAQLLNIPVQAAEPSLEQQLADLANFWSTFDTSGIGNIFG